MILSLSVPSTFLIQVLAWFCGSIKSGNLDELDIMMALSIENESLGSLFLLVHCPIVIGSQSTSESL